MRFVSRENLQRDQSAAASFQKLRVGSGYFATDMIGTPLPIGKLALDSSPHRVSHPLQDTLTRMCLRRFCQ
jgi:hypothetical protein